MKRYRELKSRLRKTHYCNFHFRQRCLRFKESCYHAHGFTDLVRMPSHELLELRQELFNIKQDLGIMKNTVLYNEKSKRYEIYKSKDLAKLRQIRAGGPLEEEDEDGEEEGDEEDESKTDPLRTLKKSVGNLNLDECRFVERIDNPAFLNKFDMNKALDSDDEYNVAKRKPRTKAELTIVRPWQNKIMA